MGLVLSWHAAALLSTAFFFCSENLFMILSMAAFTACCSIIEGQYIGYRQGSKQSKADRYNWSILAVSAMAAAVSIGIIVLLVVLFDAVPAARMPVGDIAPSILLGLGFLPQYHTFLSTWSTKGFSFGVTALDVTGSVANTVVLFGSGMSLAKAAANAAPFLVIICMQAGLVILAALIACSSKLDGAKVDTTSTQDGVSANKDGDVLSV